MTRSAENSNLFARILLAAFIVLLGAIFWQVGKGIFTEEGLNIYERGLMIIGFFMLVFGLIYVSVQRMDMRRKEKFRREKW
jgi:amino acid permease